MSWAAIPFLVVGAVLVLAGVAVLIHAFVHFVAEGAGTPAPVAPPEHLVIGGLYRYVRNPMYVGVLSAIIGQALLLGQFGLFWYAAVVFLAFFSFVRFHEEPALSRTFGTAYEKYRSAVPGWFPRVRPWNG
ncbi:hypothetical protein Aple_066170 [Acrocarpospora pleiomorpha]|uniref:Uncharacterized protein n=1 Tax=Acrocarpospora pleiomorpha TaxID=90975 RepID=A0A5M3XZC5_9ACTN|nr:hypothetical protein Aple_066170 [Acrocarpospora pleiomorpha]